MKKILLLSVLIAMAATSCKKNYSNPNQTVSVAFPTITPKQIYFSIPVGSNALPTGSQVATAYDSFYRQSCSVVVIDSTVHTLVPGLYQATAIAKNKYGYITSIPYYVAVTSISGTVPNLAGTYQIAGTEPLDSFANVVSSIGNGFYEMTNVLGNNTLSTPGADSTAIFAVITNNTIAFAGAGPSTTLSITGNWADESSPQSWPGSTYFGLTGTLSYTALTDTLSYNGLVYVMP